MVGITVGLIVMAGAANFVVNLLGANAVGAKQQQFEQATQILISNMIAEIRRAGYANAGVTLTKQANGAYYNVQGNCVTFSHSTPTDNERFYGYKLDGTTKLVYVYNSTAGNANCANLVGWTAVTDTSYIQVTNLSFTAGPGVIITFAASAVGLMLTDGVTPVKRNISATVQIRNS
jgi:hypothetical protein